MCEIHMETFHTISHIPSLVHVNDSCHCACVHGLDKAAAMVSAVEINPLQQHYRADTYMQAIACQPMYCIHTHTGCLRLNAVMPDWYVHV